jgi:hypothetical protein
MTGKLYTGLKAAGVVEEASYENRLSAIEAKLTLHAWMLGFTIAASIAILIKLLVT